ncbi:MAG: prepilin-type N-terminal cleavage/methylation domain-containing protein [Planctomycetota bacterium]
MLKRRSFGCKGGFTVLELLAVIVLIGILASIGSGVYVGAYKRMLVRKSARDFLLAAKYARILAIERQNRCVLELEQRRFALYLDVPDETSGQTQKMVVSNSFFRPVELEGEVQFEVVKILPSENSRNESEGDQTSIVFSADGSCNAALIKIGDGKNCYTIVVAAATGKVKMYEEEKDIEMGYIDLDASQI